MADKNPYRTKIAGIADALKRLEDTQQEILKQLLEVSVLIMQKR